VDDKQTIAALKEEVDDLVFRPNVLLIACLSESQFGGYSFPIEAIRRK
jgi:hypothetical protein